MNPSTRRALMLEASQAATNARDRAGLDEIAPIDVYDLAVRLGITVRFMNVSMEGFYQKATPPRIFLSSLRPLMRRAFTCAHEIGHHEFGHGSTVDELQADDRQSFDKPEEVLADAFASFLLMPSIALRGAFARRGLLPETASPLQMLLLASEFGVGYRTLISHLSMSIRDLSQARRVTLLKATPKSIREGLLGPQAGSGLTILDEQTLNQSIDLEVGRLLILPIGSTVSGDAVKPVSTYPAFTLFEAAAPGESTTSLGGRHTRLRVSKAKFVGLAKYRHLEDADA